MKRLTCKLVLWSARHGQIPAVGFPPAMSEPAESIVESFSKKVAPEENIHPEEQAPPPPYEDPEAGRPSLSSTTGPARQPAQPIVTSILIRFLTVVGYCFLVVLWTIYGYMNIRTRTLGDGSSTLVDALYSGVIGGTVLGVPFTRKGGIFDKYQNRWKLCNTHIACGRLRWGSLEFLLGTFLTLLLCWSALIVGFCIQKAQIVLTERPDMMALFEHMAYDLYASSMGVLVSLSMTSMLAIWALVKEPRISHNLEEDRFRLIVVGYPFPPSRENGIRLNMFHSVMWTCFLTSVRGSATLIHLLVVWVLPKKLMDRFVLESDKLRAADKANGVYTFLSAYG